MRIRFIPTCIGRCASPEARNAKCMRRMSLVLLTAMPLLAGGTGMGETRLEELAGKRRLNLYEGSRLSVLRSILAARAGDDEAQLRELQRAARGSGDQLEPALYAGTLLQIFSLQTRLSRYADALETFEALGEIDAGPEIPEAGVESAESLRALADGEKPIHVDGTIGEGSEEHEGKGLWSYSLLRDMPAMGEIEGDLDRLEIRCDYRRVLTEPSTGKIWKIPDEWGDCTLYVLGEPGSTFEIVEYSQKAPPSIAGEN